MKRPLFLLTILSSFACYTSFSHCSSSYSCGSYLLMSPFLQKTIGLMKNEFFGGRGTYFRMLSMRSSSDDKGGSNKNKKQKSLAPKYLPKTANQKIYCNCLSDINASIVLGVGPAGTGKTLFACTSAIQMLQRGDIHKIVLTRPVVAVEEELGFLPGNMVMKMDPWTRPIFDIFLEFYAQKDIDAMVQSGTIEISPLAYMRGRTFKRAFIIADEMQNSSPNQMLMLITRIGDGLSLIHI
jgi:phosphate starvation-inducible protein PhoH